MRRNPFWIIGFIYAFMVGVFVPLVAFYTPHEQFNTEAVIWMGASGWLVVSGYCLWRMKKELDK